MNLIIGSHVGFNKDTQLVGSIKEALSYKSNAFMFYTGAPQNTKRSEIDLNLLNEANKMLENNNISKDNIIVHAPYIINLANNQKEDSYNFSINFLKQEIKRCEILGVKTIVLHPGSHVGLGEEKGLENIVFALKKVLNEECNVSIALETMAGKGSELGTNLDQLEYIIKNVNSKNLKLCLDTCHLHDSGVDISKFDEYLDKLDSKIGIEKIVCIHINDSYNEISSHKDRHANIGFGRIGFNNLINVIYNKRLITIPKILETPYITETDESKKRLYAPYKEEIEMIRNKNFNKNVILEIRNKNLCTK